MYCPVSISSRLRKQGSRPNLLLDILGVFVAWHLGLFACWCSACSVPTSPAGSSLQLIFRQVISRFCWWRSSCCVGQEWSQDHHFQLLKNMQRLSPVSSRKQTRWILSSIAHPCSGTLDVLPPFWWVDLMIPAATVAYVRPRMLQSCCCSCPSSFRARCCWNMWRSAVALSKAWESMSGLPFGDGEMKFTSKICLEDFGEVKRNITGITLT